MDEFVAAEVRGPTVLGLDTRAPQRLDSLRPLGTGTASGVGRKRNKPVFFTGRVRPSVHRYFWLTTSPANSLTELGTRPGAGGGNNRLGRAAVRIRGGVEKIVGT